MADRTIKPDDTNDLVIQNNDGSAKLEVNEAQTIVLTGGSTTAMTIDASGNIEASVAVKTDTISEKTSATGVTIDGTLIKDNSIKPGSGQSLVLQEDGGSNALTISTNGDVDIPSDTSFTKTSSGNYTSWRVMSKTSLAQNVEWDTGISSQVAMGFLAITEADSTNPDTVLFKFSGGTMSLIASNQGYVEDNSSPASSRYGLYSGSSSTICVKCGFAGGADITISIMTSD
jgi:hypothetical protein